jgi:GNAT superfamily N-acetyltransferase
MAIEIITVSSHTMTPAQAGDVIALCSDVFHVDYEYYMELCPDRMHVLGYADGQLVAHAVWLERRLRAGAGPWLNAAYVEGVATRASFRRHGFGSAVMRRLHREISDHDLGALSPAREYEGWYARLGWLRWRGPLQIEHAGHIEPTPDDCVLVYPTPHTGALDLSASLTGEWRPFEPW